MKHLRRGGAARWGLSGRANGIEGGPDRGVFRVARAIVVALSCVLFLACGEPGARHDLGPLNGRFVIDEGVHVFPDRHWRYRDEGGMTLRKAGSLLVWVEGVAPDVLRAEFSPMGATRRFHFRCSWDGAQLWDQPQAGRGKPLTVEISAANLTPGLHRLTIERVKDLDIEKDRDKSKNSFKRIELEEVRGSESARVPITGNAFIASFLDFGVTGQTPYRLDGCLFAGPRQFVQRFSAVAESEVSFILENRSRESARFTVAIDDLDPLEFNVAARAVSPVELKVSPGDHELRLEVSGHREGSYLWGAPQLRPLIEETLPSVFFITLDTTRWDAVPPFGPDPDLTPNLAAFARESSVFSNAWATAPWTLPSHASMFTGRYPSNHGAGVSSEVLDSGWVTLAELFRDQGYMTAGFIGGHLSSSVFGLAQGFSEYHDPDGWEKSGDSVTDSALAYIEKNADSPLFVFVNYFDPHGPYTAPKRFEKAAGVAEAGIPIRDAPLWGPFVRGEKGSWKALREGGLPPNAAGMAYLRAVYMAEVAFMDSQIGRLFDRLRMSGLYDDALIVLVSDHGEFLGERGLFSHSYRLDPELTHVPMLIKRPGQVEGELIHDLVSHVDLFESIARVMGMETPVSNGRPLFPSSSALKDREFVLMEEHTSRIHPLLGPSKIADHLYGLQWLDHREILYDGRIECRSLRDDAWSPVGCTVSWEDRLGMLGERMRAAALLRADHAIGDLDREEAEKLRALGYLE